MDVDGKFNRIRNEISKKTKKQNETKLGYVFITIFLTHYKLKYIYI